MFVKTILVIAGSALTANGASVTYSYKEGYIFHETDEKDALAVGSVSPDDDHPSHFGILNIKTTGVGTDKQQMTAAGVLEGALTADRTTESIHNLNCQVR